MELNNLEKDFSNKLKERQIHPTSGAWDRLDAMLAVAENNKHQYRYRWLYIAAGIISCMLVGAVFLHLTEPTSGTENSIVIEQKGIQIPSIEPVESTQGIIPRVQTSENLTLKREIQLPVHQNQKSNNAIHSIAEIPENQKPAQSNLGASPPPEVAIAPISDAIVEVMLPSVIAIQKTTVKVNAAQLLSQVDGELEQTFRDKVINSVSKKYKTVKVALANRNQE